MTRVHLVLLITHVNDFHLADVFFRLVTVDMILRVLFSILLFHTTNPVVDSGL